MAVFLILLSCQAGTALAEPVKSSPKTARTSLTVWDTGSSSADPLTTSILAARNGWKPIARGETAASFRGDAVVSNGRILAVARSQAAGIDVYSEEEASPIARLRLLIVASDGEPAARLEQLSLTENTNSAACLQISAKTAQGASLSAKFRIKRGEVFVESEPGPDAARLRIECPSRFAVLPDFFADDILIDAVKIPPTTIEAPSDNFVLHLPPTPPSPHTEGDGRVGGGDAIGMCAFENRQQDVKLRLAGTGAQRTITASEVAFEGKKIWVAVLASPRVWYHRDLETDDAGQVIPLEWHMPFPAQWRVDFTRSDSLTDSWEMLLQEKKNAKYLKPSWLGGRQEKLNLNRWRWNTFLGTFSYPCWSDHERQGYLQPFEKEALQFKGPVVLYPINRIKETPLDAFTVVDIMRNTMGSGPCEHILDVEGQKTDYRGEPTCGVQGLLEEIFIDRKQKEKRSEVEKHLNDGLAFVTHIRSRITAYIEFGHKMREYLAAQKRAHPELNAPLNEMDKIVERIDSHVAPETAKIQPPAFVARLNDDFRKKILDVEVPDALERCKQYGKVLTDIGGNQDELVGECRWVVRTLRQRAGMLAAADPRLAPIVGEIRARTQEALRHPAGYEWSRH